LTVGVGFVLKGTEQPEIGLDFGPETAYRKTIIFFIDELLQKP